ncbi:MAG TPA: LCP family protein [Anaerolineales bacterium]|nr:LCP family protein [Anaerolineales bacterium]
MRASGRNLFLLSLGTLAVIAVLLGAAIYPKAKDRWTAPLGPGLGLPTLTPTSSIPAIAIIPGSSTPTLSAEPADLENPTIAATASTGTELVQASPTPALQPLCGGPPVMTVLALGIDGSQDYRYGLSDVIRVVRVDFVTPRVSVLSLPRDLWVEIPDIEDNYGITHGKLNQAYFYGTPGMGYYDGPGAGAGLLARTLEQNFGLRVDHYGAVNMQTFIKIVDAVGGVDVYLPTDVDGTPVDEKTEDMGYFTAGNQHFTGDQALRFSRIRKRYSELTRQDNQNIVICALKEKITSPAVLPKIPQIISAFQGSVLTDLSPEQLAQLACLAPKLGQDNLLLTSLPDEILTQGKVYSPQQKAETFVWKADYDVIRDYLDKFLAGIWPTEKGESTCP